MHKVKSWENYRAPGRGMWAQQDLVKYGSCLRVTPGWHAIWRCLPKPQQIDQSLSAYLQRCGTWSWTHGLWFNFVLIREVPTNWKKGGGLWSVLWRRVCLGLYYIYDSGSFDFSDRYFSLARIQLVCLWFPASRTVGTCSFAGVKRPERDADHLHTSRARLRMVWAIPPPPPPLVLA